MKKYNSQLLVCIFTLTTFTLFSQYRGVHPAGNKLSELFTYIDRMYVDSVDHEGISDAAIVAMLEKLDPHSSYIPADDVQSANERIDGSFVGVGIRFQIIKDTLTVVTCIPGGPSEKVGVKGGDKIIQVDNENIAGIGIKNTDVRNKLLGEKDTKVKVQILRKGKSSPIQFVITRDKIPMHSVVSHYMVDESVGYIKLTNFSRTTSEEIKTAIKSLKEQGMKDLIFDLESNPGGLLMAAKEVVDEFLKDDKLIVYSEGRVQPRAELRADKKGDFEKGRLIILIDEGSASASEIVAGAIQDWDRGLIVGRRSFGKGLVQRPIELSDGSQIRLTIARYFTPSGRFIQKPYDDLESYRLDRLERYKNGEMTNKDSIKFADSLKYETKISKRTVYGGGGIMPDIFVPLDTSDYSDYYRDLSRSGVINTFAASYVDKHRKTIKKEHENELQNFIDHFEMTEELMNDFFEYANAEDSLLVFVEEDYEISKEILQLRLKAMIAQNIWDYTAFYQIINPKNEIFMRAYEILSEDEYDSKNLNR